MYVLEKTAKTMAARRTLMLSTWARGGIRSVVERYENDGVFARWNVTFIPTHVEGAAASRIGAFLVGFVRLIVSLMSGKVGLVHCHAAMRGSFWRKSLVASVSRAFGVPVLLHLHGSEMKSFYGGLPAWAQSFASFQLRKASAVLVLSESWYEFVRSVSPRANVVILPNYVTLPDVARTRRARAAPDNLQVVFLGLIGERKGIYDLLPAFQIASRKISKLRLVVGGNGEIEKARAVARELHIDDKVDFRGWISATDKERLLASSDIFVLPSHNEGLPVSILEAMSWRLAIIATAVGGIPELVRHQIDGVLIASGDIELLALSLVRLSEDVGLREAMGDSGRLRVEQLYSRKAVLPELEKLYRCFVLGGT